VWQPAEEEVGEDFVPYLSNGRWLAGPTGWTFDSGYPWGWAAFHFGRWVSLPQRGWVWTEEGLAPAPVWGGAWVVWRTGGNLVGWCPQPPAGASRDLRRDDSLWSVVPLGDLQSRDLAGRALPSPPRREWSGGPPAVPGPTVGPFPSWRGYPHPRAATASVPTTNNSFLLAVPADSDPGAIVWTGWGAAVHAPMGLGRAAGASPLSTGPGSSVFATPGLGASPSSGPVLAPRRLGGGGAFRVRY
jgi:hypothetical protein